MPSTSIDTRLTLTIDCRNLKHTRHTANGSLALPVIIVDSR